MKKKVIAVMLSMMMAVGSVGGSSVFAAETTAQEASEIAQEEEMAEPEVSEEYEDASSGAIEEDVSEAEPAQVVVEEAEAEPIQEIEKSDEIINSIDTEITSMEENELLEEQDSSADGLMEEENQNLEEEEIIEDKITDLMEESSPVDAQASVSNTAIVSFAAQYEGYPYAWGTHGPNSFDCSGFVYYVFNHFGIELSCSSSDYWSNPGSFGTVVSESAALPGDIVSWEGHVGICTGDGYCINALSPGVGVAYMQINAFINGNNTLNPPHKYIRVNGVSYSGSTDIADPIPTGAQIIPDGNYHIVSALDNSKGLDVYRNYSEDGTNVDLYANAEDSTQVFTVRYLGDGSYAIIHKSSGKSLEVGGAALYNGANVNIWTSNNTSAQKWVISGTGDGRYFNIISMCNGRYLDVANGSTADLTNIQVYSNNGSSAQKWRFIPAEELVAPGTQCISDGTYHIVSALDNSKGIDVYNNDSTDGTNVDLYANTADDNQVFTVKYLGDGFYSLIHKSSGKYLDVYDASIQFGANVTIWTSNNTKAQQWVIKSAGDGQHFNIISRCNGLYLDVADGATSNFTNIQVYRNNGTNAQKWKFISKMTWKLTGTDDDLTLTISGNGEMENYSFTKDAPWAYARDKIKTVVIEEGITRIGAYAFYGCENLTGITIPDGVTNIGRDAFHGCSSLESITLPDGVTSIEEYAFYECNNLSGVLIPESVTGIGESALSAPKEIYVVSGSYAEQYAKDNNINYKVICKTHHWNEEFTVDKEATCSEEGSESIHCSVCDVVKEGSARAIEKLAHTYGNWSTTKAANCTEAGSRKKTCKVCGDEVTEEIPAKGHTWNKDYTIDKEPTFTEEGSKSIHCAVCDAVKDGSVVSIPKLTKQLGKTTRGDMFNLANNVKVTWKEVPGAKYYKVYREGITDKKETRTDPVIVTERLIGWDSQPGLTNGHAYRYKIVASLSGKGDSSGDSTLSYSKLMYRLKTVVIRSVKNTAPGKVTVKYDKTTSGDSYVLQYCERQDMAGAKTKVVLGADNTSYVIGGLKKGKTYYISIRVRKKVEGIDYYTTFGVPKRVTITQ